MTFSTPRNESAEAPVHNPYMIQGSYPLMPQSSFGMTGGSFVAPPAPVPWLRWSQQSLDDI